MGNSAQALRGIRLGGSSVHLDELTSTGEVMLRVARQGVRQIEEDAECMDTIRLLINLVGELDHKKDGNKVRPRLGERFEERNKDTTQLLKTGDRLVLRVANLVQEQSRFDDKQASRSSKEDSQTRYREHRPIREHLHEATRLAKQELIPQRPIRAAMISSDEGEADERLLNRPSKDRLPEARVTENQAGNIRPGAGGYRDTRLFGESTDRVLNEAVASYGQRDATRGLKHMTRQAELSSHSIVDAVRTTSKHRSGSKDTRGKENFFDQAEPAESIDVDFREEFRQLSRGKNAPAKYTSSEEDEDKQDQRVAPKVSNERPRLGAVDRKKYLEAWNEDSESREDIPNRFRRTVNIPELPEQPRRNLSSSKPGARPPLGNVKAKRGTVTVDDDSDW